MISSFSPKEIFKFLANRLELLFLIVRAFPKAYKIGLQAIIF
jgi:hypothetical protein